MNMSVTTTVNFRTFQPPPNYTEKSDCSEEQLFIEDLNDEDNELWLFQTSRDFDSSSLKNKVISLQGETVFQNENCLLKEKSHKVSVSANSENELLNYQLLLPSRSNNGLFTASLPFAGFLSLTENINVSPFISPSHLPEKEKEGFSNLRQRYVPFGSDEPLTTIDTSKHKHRKKSDTNHSNEHIVSDPPVSVKKRVSFKCTLTETQERNVSIEAENNLQQDPLFPDANGSHKRNKQKKLCENDPSQEIAMPKEAKSKKKTKCNKPYSNEEKSSSFEAVLIPFHERDPSEEAESARNCDDDSYFLDAQKLHKVKKKELLENDDSQDDATIHTKSKKKKKSSKSQRNEHAESNALFSEEKFSSSNALLTQSQENGKPETIASFQQCPHSPDTKSFWNMPEQRELAGNDNFQSDTKHTKSKKKKKKSNEYTNRNDSESEDIKLLSLTPQPDKKNISVEAHSNRNSQDTKCLVKTDKQTDPFVFENNVYKQNEVKSIGSCEQDSGFINAQRSHKRMKRKELSESDGSQDDITKHRKSKKRKMSDKFWRNDYVENDGLVSEQKLTLSNPTLIQSQKYNNVEILQQNLCSSDTQNINIMPMQRELSLNDSFQADIKYMKSKKKKKKSNEYTSSNDLVSEEEKLLCTTPLIQPNENNVSLRTHNDRNSLEIKYSTKMDMQAEPFVTVNNFSKDSSIADDKSHTKKEKKIKKHDHKNVPFHPESLNEFEEIEKNNSTYFNTEEKGQDFKTKCYSKAVSLIGSNQECSTKKHKTKKREDNSEISETLQSFSAKQNKHDSSVCFQDGDTVTKDEPCFNLNIVKKECHSIDNQENMSAKKERKKRKHNQTENNQVLSDENNKGNIFLPLSEETPLIKKHKEKKRKDHCQLINPQAFTGNSSKSEEFGKLQDDDVTLKEEKSLLNVSSIKQECPSDSNEIPTKRHKRRREKSGEQFEYSSYLSRDVKDCASGEFSGNTINKEMIDVKSSAVNHKCLSPSNTEKDNSKHFITAFQKDEKPYLNLSCIKQEVPPTAIEKQLCKKHKEKKICSESEILQVAIKEEALSDDQTNKNRMLGNCETVRNQKSAIIVKQEVLSDCDIKFSVKQEYSGNEYAALMKVIKKEIKPDSDGDNLVVKKHTKRKHSENSEESCSESAKDIINCNKVKKSKMHKKSKY